MIPMEGKKKSFCSTEVIGVFKDFCEDGLVVAVVGETNRRLV